jgi:transcriptional regulator with XRE-family HTH domain
MAKPSPLHSGHPALVALGTAIRELRSELGLSQEGLAHEICLDRSYIGGIERGEHNLTLMNLLKIAERLGVEPSDLLKHAKL